MSNVAKLARFAARIRAEDKRRLERAAELTGRSLTEFVMSSAYEAAAQTIERFDGLALVDARDRAIFVDAMLRPPAPNARLRKAARRYQTARSGKSR